MSGNFMVIGIGNEYRSDDGAGLMVARAIRQKQISSVMVKENSGDGAALMDLWQGFQNVILIDAVSSGTNPGTIFKFRADDNLPSEIFKYSSHSFGLTEAIKLAKTMNKLPADLWIFGIEGRNFSAGTNISQDIQQSIKQTADEILDHIHTTG